MWAGLALGAFVLAVVVHLLTTRARLPFSNVVRYILFGGAIGAVLVMVLLVLYGLSGQMLAGATIFAFLSELYIFLFTLVNSSVSVSLLLYLRAGPMDDQQIAEIFTPTRMVTFRLDQLVANGLAEVRDGRYTLTPSGRRLVWWFTFLRGLMGHEHRTASVEEAGPR